MALDIRSRLKHAWTAFRENRIGYRDIGGGYSYRPDRIRLTRGNERSIVTSLINRIAVDGASIDIRHVKLDDNGRFSEEIDSSLNSCFKVSANIDQTPRAFMVDCIVSLLDEGCIAIVPTKTEGDPILTESYKIDELRVGKVVEWYPKHVRVDVYNDETGRKEQVVLPKDIVAIVENPFYPIMNEPNSTMQRLIRKLNILDVIDEQSGSGKLDIIVQLPYVVKGETRKQQAEERRKAIEQQLAGSKYGIAYTDGTERITQLNRPAENNLMSQIEYLTSMLLSQLGITQGILDGSANEETMNNYYNRIIEPILSVLVESMRRTFLSKTARSQKQTILYFRDPFKLMPVSNVAEIADKFTRNEIMTSNEIRQIVGMKPSDDPHADELRNKNLSQSTAEVKAENGEINIKGGNQNETEKL